jgi:hypothetical protein
MLHLFHHMLRGDPSRCPGILKIEAAGYAIDI